MSSFDDKYPYISAWVEESKIEFGYGYYDDIFVRATDAGGTVWEGKNYYESMDDALADLEAGIKAWSLENGIDTI